MQNLKNMYKQVASTLVIFFLGLPSMSLAQEVDLRPGYVKDFVEGESYKSWDYPTIGLTLLRFFLVAAIVVAGYKALHSGYSWLTYERNDDKAYESKENFGFWLAFITIDFILLAFLRYYLISDFSTLGF